MSASTAVENMRITHPEKKRASIVASHVSMKRGGIIGPVVTVANGSGLPFTMSGMVGICFVLAHAVVKVPVMVGYLIARSATNSFIGDTLSNLKQTTAVKFVLSGGYNGQKPTQ